MTSESSQPAVPPWLGAHIEEHALLLVGLLLFGLFVQTFRLWLSRSLAARRVGKHREQGASAERTALKLLKKAGYSIASKQTSGSYQFFLDGVPSKVNVRADFLVERGGKTYVAEVKSGAESAKVTARATRRQLLEYTLAFDVEGILLIDMHDRRIRQVEFPRCYDQ